MIRSNRLIKTKSNTESWIEGPFLERNIEINAPYIISTQWNHRLTERDNSY
jgi:hypothetical protein